MPNFYPNGASTASEYLVGASDGTLSAERVVTDTATAVWDLATSGQAKVNVQLADIEIRCDANPTLATGYEIVRGYLRTKHVYDTPTARGIAAASPEYGWTWANRTNLSSVTSNENTTTANAVYGKVTTTNSDWFGGTLTAPQRYQLINPAGRAIEVIALIYCNASANYEEVEIVIVNDASTGNFVRLGVGWNAGSGAPCILSVINAVGVRAAITTAQRDAGCWLRIRMDPHPVAPTISTGYNTTASSSPPTSWTTLQQSTFTGGPYQDYRVGQMWCSTNTAGNLAGGAKWFGVSLFGAPPLEMSSPAFFHGRQYDTTAAAQTLIGSFDLGASSATISDTELRAALAAAEGHLQDDSGATWTYSAVRDSSPSPAAGSYSAAGSVSVSGTGRYFALYAKCTSDGATHGSFHIAGFRLRATV